MDRIIKILIERLVGKGIEVSTIPAYIRNLANIIAVDAYLSREELNRQLQLMGWDDFELDDHTFQLIMAVFENNGLKSWDSDELLWFKNIFNTDKINSKN